MLSLFCLSYIVCGGGKCCTFLAIAYPDSSFPLHFGPWIHCILTLRKMVGEGRQNSGGLEPPLLCQWVSFHFNSKEGWGMIQDGPGLLFLILLYSGNFRHGLQHAEVK